MSKWDDRFIELARQVSTWSTCKRRQCGAVIVRDKRILTTGYNGAPSGLLECTNGRECIREKLQIPSGQRHELCVGVHAEQNAIIQAALHGTPIAGSTIYIYGGSPCTLCTRMMINAGIKRIVYCGTYDDELSLLLLSETDIELLKYGD